MTNATAINTVQELTEYIESVFLLKRFLPILLDHYRNALNLAESLYGPRDDRYYFVGFLASWDIGNRATIHQYDLPDRTKTVSIDVPLRCLDYPNLTAMAVAHEVVHCLSPVDGEYANYLEEGAAEFCAESYTHLCGYCYDPLANRSDYAEAYSLVRQLLLIDRTIIKRIRMSTA